MTHSLAFLCEKKVIKYFIFCYIYNIINVENKKKG